MKLKRMRETDYRASRLCRVLANPTAYKILKLLCKARMSPSAIARKLTLSRSVVSQALVLLKLGDLVRYDTLPSGRIYWVKDRSVPRMLATIEHFVEKARFLKW